MTESVTIGLGFLWAIVVLAATSLLIGKERKAKWFKKRTKYTMFTRRSPIGEILHFGYPHTVEGCIVTAVMVIVIVSPVLLYRYCF